VSCGDGWRWPRTGATRTPNAAAQAAWSCCAGRAARGRDGNACAASHRAGERQSPQRWRDPRSKRFGARGSERSVHRGPCGASLKHRARNAGDTADLRLIFGRRSFRNERCRHCSDAARRRGPWVRRGPGVPRALVSCPGREGVKAHPRLSNNRAGEALAVAHVIVAVRPGKESAVVMPGLIWASVQSVGRMRNAGVLLRIRGIAGSSPATANQEGPHLPFLTARVRSRPIFSFGLPWHVTRST
jgi:hypothetical protein